MKNRCFAIILLFCEIVFATCTVNAEDLIDAKIMEKHFSNATDFKVWYNTLTQDDKNQVLAGSVVLCKPSFAEIALSNGGDVNTEVYVIEQYLHTHKYGDRADHLIYTKGSMHEISEDAARRPAGEDTFSKIDDHDAMHMLPISSMYAKVSLLTGVIKECKGEERKQLVQLLLKNGVDLNAINEKNENAFSSVVRHVRQAKEDAKETDASELLYLLIQNIPPNGLNPEISTALILEAYKEKDINLIKLYKDAKLKLSIETQSAKEAFVDLPLMVPFRIFANFDDVKNKADYVVQLLTEMLDMGMDVNTRNKYGETALFNAIRAEYFKNKMNEKIVRLLLDKGADVNAQDKYGRTALFRAVYNQDLAAVKLLLEYKADASIIDNKGKSVFSAINPNQHTPLNPEIYQLLIKHGAQVKYLNKDFESAFKIVKVSGSAEALNILLDNGLDASLHNDVGYTLLMAAARSNDDDVEIVQTLLAHGADVNAKSSGTTALSIAKQVNNQKIISSLQKNKHY